jgi:hypothetical protein
MRGKVMKQASIRVIKELEKDERRMVREIAQETKQTEGEVRRILFGRKNGKAKWEAPE